MSVPFSFVAFSSSLTPGRDLSQFWVANSACSINLTAFRSDYVTFDPPSVSSRVGGVSGTIHALISKGYTEMPSPGLIGDISHIYTPVLPEQRAPAVYPLLAR